MNTAKQELNQFPLILAVVKGCGCQLPHIGKWILEEHSKQKRGGGGGVQLQFLCVCETACCEGEGTVVYRHFIGSGRAAHQQAMMAAAEEWKMTPF